MSLNKVRYKHHQNLMGTNSSYNKITAASHVQVSTAGEPPISVLWEPHRGVMFLISLFPLAPYGRRSHQSDW